MPSEIRAAERVQLCAENNADLYDAVFRAHNLSSARTGAFWSSHRTAPTYYSNLVALSSAKTEEQLQEIENLKQSIEGIFFVKDSYHALDLSDHGFQLLFTSTWIWGEPEALTAPLSLPPTWVKISKQQDLDLWQKIWMESGSPADKPVFAPDILSDANVAILGRRDSNGGFDGGCIANRSSDVIGISNIFAKEGAPSAAAGAIGAASTAFGSKLPLVGYENGDDLAEMVGLGFVGLTSLRVWMRKS